MIYGSDIALLILGVLALFEMRWCYKNNWYAQFEEGEE